MASYGGNEGGVEFNDVENVELICKQLRQHFREMCLSDCWVRMGEGLGRSSGVLLRFDFSIFPPTIIGCQK